MSVILRRFSLPAFAAGLGLLAAAVPASACLNGVTVPEPRERRPHLIALPADQSPVDHLIVAEEALRLGRHVRAAQELDAIRRAMRAASPRVKARFERVSALVAIRSAGEWPRWVDGRAPNNSAEREATMKEALAVLRQRAKEAPDDPVRTTDLGVGLFGFTDRHGEARQLLEKLAARDLLTTAYAYLALSRLRAAAGNQPGASAALETCRKLDSGGGVCGAGGSRA